MDRIDADEWLLKGIHHHTEGVGLCPMCEDFAYCCCCDYVLRIIALRHICAVTSSIY